MGKKAIATAAKSQPKPHVVRKVLKSKTTPEPDEGAPCEKKDLEAPVDKSDYSKLHSAMKYQASKANTGPLNSYMQLKTRAEKAEFCKKWLQDKKFNFLQLEHTRTEAQSSSSKNIEGWKTRFQIAQIECLPPDSELLASLLTDMPSREHPNKDWKEKGEMEFYYTGRLEFQKGEKKKRELHLHQSGKITQEQGFALDEEMDKLEGGGQPQRAIADGSVKQEPDSVTPKKWEQLQKDLRKQGVLMGSLNSQVLAPKGNLQQLVTQKTYLTPLLDELNKQIGNFTPHL